MNKVIIIKNLRFYSMKDAYITYGLCSNNNDIDEFKQEYIKKYGKDDLEIIEFETIEEACEYFNVPEGRVKRRIGYFKRPRPGRSAPMGRWMEPYYNYWTIAQALEIEDPPQSYVDSRSKEIIVGDKTFKSIREACRYYDIPRTLVNSRLKAGWTNEETFEVVPRKRKKKR